MEYYKLHENEPIEKWLRVKEIFRKPGVQGMVGVFESTSGKTSEALAEAGKTSVSASIKTSETHEYVFKVSRYVNYLIHHEINIGNALETIREYCPHFCRVYGGTVANCSPDVKCENPFLLTKVKYPIEKEVLLMEHLSNSSKLSSYVRSERIDLERIISAIKQVLIGVLIAQQSVSFTHYDLHSNNVMMRKCDRDLVHFYITPELNALVPTHGSYPVIIDYGFAYANTLDGNYLWPSMGHTKAGMSSDRFDRYADPKLFLVTIASELEECRDECAEIKKLNNIVRNAFGPLKIDWESGWDTKFSKSIADYALEIMEPIQGRSHLFSKYDYHCLDLIETLIILPLEEKDFSKAELSFKAFLNEFVKIEEIIGNDYYSLYMLKNIVDYARGVRASYANKVSRTDAVNTFRELVYKKIDEITKYVDMKHVHFEKMLCGLICFSECVEGIYYARSQKELAHKTSEYSKLPFASLEELFRIIDFNIQDEYEVNMNTTIRVIDSVKKRCFDLKLTPELIEDLNNTEPALRGDELYAVLCDAERGSGQDVGEEIAPEQGSMHSEHSKHSSHHNERSEHSKHSSHHNERSESQSPK